MTPAQTPPPTHTYRCKCGGGAVTVPDRYPLDGPNVAGVASWSVVATVQFPTVRCAACEAHASTFVLVH